MKLRAVVAVLALGLAVTGCEATRQAIGLGKNPPDEFQVVAHPPLSMPPQMTLPPPDPGAPRPQEGSAESQAETAILANSSNGGMSVQPLTDTSGSAAALTPSEDAFLQSAGATGPSINPAIRTQVDQEASAEVAASQTLMDKLAFWRTPEPPGTIVDPVAEQQRLQQNAALGQPITTGATPIIVRRKKALFEGIF